MAIRDIVLEKDPILREQCRVVTAFDARLAVLLDDMKETMHSADGVGLAAPQVGILKRVAVVDTGDGEELVEMVNPIIVKTKGEEVAAEGCLSIPERHGYVKRPREVTVKAQDRFGKEFTVKADGFRARAFCHEIDHLDGILYIDKLCEKPEDMPDEGSADGKK